MNTKKDHLVFISRQPMQSVAKFQKTRFLNDNSLDTLINQANQMSDFGEDFNRHLQNTFEVLNLNL